MSKQDLYGIAITTMPFIIAIIFSFQIKKNKQVGLMVLYIILLNLFLIYPVMYFMQEFIYGHHYGEYEIWEWIVCIIIAQTPFLGVICGIIISILDIAKSYHYNMLEIICFSLFYIGILTPWFYVIKYNKIKAITNFYLYPFKAICSFFITKINKFDE